MTHRRKTLNHEFLGDSFAEAKRSSGKNEKKKGERQKQTEREKGEIKENGNAPPRGINSFYDVIVETVENDCLPATRRMTDRKLIPISSHAYFPYFR